MKLRPIVDWGHGIVFPRRDRKRVKCGGVAFCPHCMYDLALLQHLEGRGEIPNTAGAWRLETLCRRLGPLQPFWHVYGDGHDPECIHRVRTLFDRDPRPRYLRA